ncbi:hypothetical protein ACIF80_36350 [Streptomyces sp. NPDC085927]|uniref:hypothetical protein n=1 Tax=Streptomyces sp. NPDC085927 TaxID=3365738 RepID=UPI0037CF70B9
MHARPKRRTGGRVITPPHHRFKKNAPDRYEERYERQRTLHPAHDASGSSTVPPA